MENIDAVVRVRGNATATYPKRPYKIKFNKKTSVLGMDKNKSWVLLANYCDKSLMRPAIGFKTSELLNMPWTPKFKYVELVLNGEYLGNYQLVESVKEGKNRVNIDESGYLIEIDDSYYYREPVYFTTSTKNHFYSYKYPDYENITADINNYIKNWIDDFEKILYSDDDIAFDLETGYSKYIDLDSWARNFICQNILKNGDTNFFMHKYDNTDNSKLERSPLWDFEWSIGIGWYYGERPNPEHGLIVHPYYERLLDDPVFKAYVKNIWNTECNNIKQDLLSYYDDLEELLYKSQELNFKRWDILNKRVSVGGIPLGSFKAEIECDKQYLSNHIDWFDQTINEL